MALTGAWRCLCLAALMAALAACQQPTVESQLAEAGKLEQKGDLQGAVTILKGVLLQEPQNGEARLRLGIIFRQNGEPRAAEHHLREALNAKYDPKVVLPLLAQALFEQAEFQKVLDSTRSIVYGEAALQPEILALRGHSQLSLGRLEDAAASFEEALKLNPSHTSTLLGQARLAVLAGNAAAAAAIVDKIISADPASLDAWLMKGDFERSTGNVEAAIASYQKALALRPRGLAPNLNLATIYMESGQLKQAEQHVQTILQVAPESAAGNYIQGLLQYQNKNFAAADEAVKKVLKAVPGHLPATALAGMVALAQGSDARAEQYLSDAVTRYPRSSYLRKALATVLLKADKVREALEVLAPAASLAKEDPALATLIAEARFRNNDLAEARKYFEIAARQDPRSSRARAGLGLSRLAAGDVERALADLESAVTLGSSTADAYLIRTLLATNRHDKALEAVARLEKERPTDPVTYNLKGSTLFARGDIAGARKAFERAVELHPLHLAATINLAQLDTREGNVVAARGRFERVLARDPKNVGAMLALADLAIATGKLDEAMSWANRARELQPKAYAVSMLMAKLLFSQGDYAGTLPVAAAALAVNPDSADALNMLAYSQLRAGRRAQALESYAALVRRKPNSAEAHYGLGGARLEDGQLAAAERSFQKSLELRPAFPEAIQALVALQLRMGKIADASRLANDTQRKMPKSPLGRLLLGDVAMAEKRPDAALKAYQSAFEMQKSSVILVKLHGAMREAGKPAAAEALAIEWLAKYPNDNAIRYLVADAATRKQDFRLAAEQYRYVLKSDPKNLAVLHNLVIAYEQLKDPKAALEAAQSALKIAPKDPGALHDLGRLLVDAGNADRAIELLEEARLAIPNSDLLRYSLARAYAKAGNYDRAKTELEQLLRGKNEFAERGEAAALLKKLQN